MKPIIILIKTELSSRRLAYVLSFMSNCYSGIRFVMEANCVPDYTIGYGVEGQEYDFYIPSHEFIQEQVAMPETIESSGMREEATLFDIAGKEVNHSLSYDIFSAIFFMLTRVEEYSSSDLDAHGRYKSHNSWLSQVDALNIPIVNIWISQLLEQLSKCTDTQLILTPQISKLLITFDVDIPWYHKHVPLTRRILRKIKYFFKPNVVFEQGDINSRDPYDTFDAIAHVLKEHQIDSLWFLLLSAATRNDAILPSNHKRVDELFIDLKKKYKLCVHPSYQSSRSTEVMQREMQQFQALNNQEPELHSRQHFLRMTLPETYHNLSEQGVTDEYSMGYADMPGYRAGTSFPFFWYDMSREKITSMKVHPLVIMDVSLADYKGISSEDALAYYTHFANITKTYGGEMVVLWHNSFFSQSGDMEGWWELFVKTCEMSKDFSDKSEKK